MRDLVRARLMANAKSGSAGGQPTRIVKPVDGKYVLDFARADVARIDAVDLDLVLTLRDGTRVVLVNAAIDAMDVKPPQLVFADGQVVSTARVYDEVGQVERVKFAQNDVSSAEQHKDKKGGPQDENKDGANASDGRSDAPVQKSESDTLAEQADKAAQAAGAYEDPPGVPPTPPVTVSPFSSVPLKPGVIIQKKPEEITEIISPAAPVIDMKLVNVVGQSSVGSTIKGSGGMSPSDTDPNPVAQSAPEIITGTAGNDIIEGDSLAAPDGYFAKVLTIALFGVSEVFAVRLSGLPAEFTVSNATRNADGSWQLAIDANTDFSNLQVVITYPVSDDAQPSQFAMSTTFDVADAQGLQLSVGETINVLMRDVNGPADILQNDPVTGEPVFVLPLRGLADEIHAGDGDDIVYGQAGSDLILGEGGNDQLYGGVGDDVLVGGAGADLLDGGTGSNTASYADSAAPVQVDLSAGSASGGDADGDTLVSIQNVIGTEGAMS
ncbi:MAG: calcium-binding protein [Burkholderiaceae bacterium]